MRNTFVLIILSSILVFFSGCNVSSISPEEEGFVKLLKNPKVQDVNRSIGIKIDPVNSSKIEPFGTINLIIYNQSQKTIGFPAGGDVQIFLFSEEINNWKEVKNAVKYYGKDVLIVPNGEGLDIRPIAVQPDYISNENEKEQRIRLAVTGYVVKDGQKTDEAVSAFINLKAKP